ncbi:hypothetical protein [Sphaerimonospora thailandensis]|uniref:Uncharacterized protein n=1 Tax=Sphaerimonospora thailandensis TaxID=795644 RepID=A0A8J3VYH8_9ACTN|nr:hypothetical protein [Sphaerimonospora thailandensis]GIH69452.1 hypothetical protein Mth01_17050 [Sphaerimonospora thailandensis]
MASEQLRTIRAALDSLPAQCIYHGENTEPPSGSLLWREACCDTGIPAQRRKLAEQALDQVAVTHGAG